MDTLLLICNLVAVIVAVGLVRYWFGSYLQEKGKNLATKEDIEHITEKIETVRASVGSQAYVHQRRYDREYDVLRELTEKLVDLRDAAMSLRPEADIVDARETDEQRKTARLTKFGDAAVELYKIMERRQPFYPRTIYSATRVALKRARREAIQYKHAERFDDKYWEDAQKSADEIAEFCEATLTAVRDRVQQWETFPPEAGTPGRS